MRREVVGKKGISYFIGMGGKTLNLAELIKNNAKRILKYMSKHVRAEDNPKENQVVDDKSRENAKKILGYISSLAFVGRQRVSNIETNADYLWYGSRLHLPGIQENQIVDGECAWLTVDRLEPESPPELPSILQGWVSVPDSPALQPTPKSDQKVTCSEDEADEMITNGVARRENVHNIPDEDGMCEVVLLWDDQPMDVKESFDLYLSSEWSPWAAQEKPRLESITIYKKLYDYYRMMEGMDETDLALEVVFGLGIAKKYNNNAPEYILSVVEQLGEIKLDIATAQIAVCPRLGIEPAIALDPFQDQPTIAPIRNVFQGIRNDANAEFKPWDSATYSRIVEAAKACLAPDAQIVSGEVDTKDDKPNVLTFYLDYAVFVRQRDEGLRASAVAKAFDEFIQCNEVNLLPPTLTSLVGTQGNQGNNANLVTVDNEDDGADSHRSATSYYFPLPCNKEQENIIKKLEGNCAGVVVQGPPGTGKSHTIANIICHYLARGRRVLVTSHAAPALAVLRDKLPEEIQPFAISVLGTDVSSKREIEKTLIRLLEIHGQGEWPNIGNLEKRSNTLLAEKLRLEENIKLLTKKILAHPPQHLFGDQDTLIPDEFTTERLAIWCAENYNNFSWFSDRPPIDSNNAMGFSDGDISRLREARQSLGNDLCYVGKTLPQMQRLPSADDVFAWHEHYREDNDIKAGNVPRHDVFGIRTALVQSRFKRTQKKQRETFEILGHAESDIAGSMLTFLKDRIGGQENANTISHEWAQLKRSLESIHQKKSQLEIVVALTTQLENSGANEWAHALRTAPVIDGEADIPDDWREAWRWGCANAYLDSIDSTSNITTSAERLVQIRKDMEQNSKRVVEAHVVHGLKTTLLANNVLAQGLAEFQTAMNQMPRDPNAITAPFIRRRAQQALVKCYSAIPCWVMPWNKVNEMLPKTPGAFDLVVVDEASQSGIMELLSLWRGKKALVIGDDKQVSPTVIAEFAVQEGLFHKYTRDLPNRNALSPRNSLFDVARSLFADKFVMLREHFRCAEPIIAFSSRHFYSNQIVPLRVPTTTERLSSPLVRVYVPNGFRDDRKVNKQEACGIVEEIQKIVNTLAMDERTIGVISLLGTEQVRHIWTELRSKIPEDKINRHKIECGSAAHFQGKERDIVLLSMVASPGRATALTSNVFRQRYNVAVSRARDRLYLFHSVPLEQLHNPDDMQRLLLEHFDNPMPQARPDGPEALCESDFERRVFRRLAQAGYAVTPQVGSQGFRIDLVVEGENGQRLAIELDGDAYHQDFEKDYDRQQILERVGWTFWRCFASTYWCNTDGVFQDLRNKLTTMGIEPWNRDENMINNYTEVRKFAPQEDNNREENDTGTNENQNVVEGANPNDTRGQMPMDF